MPYEVIVQADYHELVEWLTEHVGPKTEEGPVFNNFWKNSYKTHPFSCLGKNWSVNIVGLSNPFTFKVRVYDSELATLVGLRWL